jgi:cytochrome c oxidase assembly protein subunit 15
MSTEFTPSKSVIVWLWSGILLILIMVSIGGLTRLTHSGLSMTHWTFTGSFPPMNDAEWNIEFDKYKTSPEFVELHNHFALEDFKSIFWWEYIHRMFGRMIGLVFIFPFVFFLIKRKIPMKLLPQFLIILGLGALQALLGWFMVKSGLIDVPRVSHYRLSAHLITAFVTCAYIFWALLNYSGFGKLKKQANTWSHCVGLLIFLLITQIIFGGFVAGLKAGWVHNTWPLMDGSLIAPSVFAMDPIWINFFEGKSGVQFIHRTLGILIFLYVAYVSWRIVRLGEKPLVAPAMLLAFSIFTQVTLGVLTLLLLVPISLAVVHQVFALVTLLSGVWLWHRLKYTRN